MTDSPLVPSGGLSDTVSQLWGRALELGDHRVTYGSHDAEPQWTTVRTFDVVGRRSHPQLLVERGAPAAVARSLTAYRNLRTWRPRVVRSALALSARVGRLPGQALTLQRRADADGDGTEPLASIEAAMGQPFLAHIGIRRGANAKPTAQLFAHDGEPIGYAKIAWNELTKGYVDVEARRLTELDGTAGPARVPRILATADSRGMPFVVVEPLPPQVRQPRRADDLTLAELCTISPISRIATPGSSRQFTRLRDRLHTAADDPVVSRASGRVLELVARIGTTSTLVPIMRHDHGDLAPWNSCRDEDGQLWLWDWEMSEEDTVGGTDIVHWYVHAVHGPAPTDLVAAITDAGQRAASAHRALGIGSAGAGVVLAVYALMLAERAIGLAITHGSWERNRVGESDVLGLAAFGCRQFGPPL